MTECGKHCCHIESHVWAFSCHIYIWPLPNLKVESCSFTFRLCLLGHTAPPQRCFSCLVSRACSYAYEVSILLWMLHVKVIKFYKVVYLGHNYIFLVWPSVSVACPFPGSSECVRSHQGCQLIPNQGSRHCLQVYFKVGGIYVKASFRNFAKELQYIELI